MVRIPREGDEGECDEKDAEDGPRTPRPLRNPSFPWDYATETAPFIPDILLSCPDNRSPSISITRLPLRLHAFALRCLAQF